MTTARMSESEIIATNCLAALRPLFAVGFAGFAKADDIQILVYGGRNVLGEAGLVVDIREAGVECSVVLDDSEVVQLMLALESYARVRSLMREAKPA